MAKSKLTIFEEMATSIRNTAVPIESHEFLPEEPTRYALALDMSMGGHTSRLDVTDSIIEKTRFTAATIAGSSFDRVIFRTCDLSGVTFVNCLFRDCLIVGSKSSAHLAFIDCTLDNILVGQTRLERLEFQDSKIGVVTLCDLSLQHLLIHDCEKYKRDSRLTMTNVELSGATGLDTLHSCGVQVKMDAALWRALSDSFMREKGFEEIGEAPAKETSQQFTRLATSLEI